MKCWQDGALPQVGGKPWSNIMIKSKEIKTAARGMKIRLLYRVSSLSKRLCHLAPVMAGPGLPRLRGHAPDDLDKNVKAPTRSHY